MARVTVPSSTLRRKGLMPSKASRTAVKRSLSSPSNPSRTSRVLGVRADLGDGGVGGVPGAPQRGERVRGPAIGEIDEGLAAFLLQDADGVLGGVADLLDEGRHREQLGHTSPCEYRGEAPDGGQGHQRHEKQRHHLPADRLPAKAHGLPQLKPPTGQGVHLCVNEWREPTTDAQVTRRAIRKPNFRTGDETWGVVRALREIASRDPTASGDGSSRSAGPVGRKFILLGNLRGRVDRPSVREMGAESATGAASRPRAA